MLFKRIQDYQDLLYDYNEGKYTKEIIELKRLASEVPAIIVPTYTPSIRPKAIKRFSGIETVPYNPEITLPLNLRKCMLDKDTFVFVAKSKTKLPKQKLYFNLTEQKINEVK